MTDSSAPGFAGGTLTVAMASAGTADDRLSILNQGNGPGQIAFDGSTVWYGTTQIGTATITFAPATLSVALNASATTAAVQALLDDITYQNVATSPTTAPRYVRFGAIDGAGLASNLAIETVVNSGLSTGAPPRTRPPIVTPTPTPTGPPPLGPGSPTSTPPSQSSPSGTPPPASAPSPVETGSHKQKHKAGHPHHQHKHPATKPHRPRPRSARPVKDRRGEAGRFRKQGGP